MIDDAVTDETGLDRETIAERRLDLAAALFGWSHPRRAAYREGYRDQMLKAADFARISAHDPEQGYLEASLEPAIVDSMGYGDGAEAAGVAHLSPDGSQYLAMDADQSRQYASHWFDQAEDRDLAETAEWSFDARGGTEPFLSIMSRREWADWLRNEHECSIQDGRPGYVDLLTQDIMEPIVCVEGEDGIGILDGWHRVAATMARGSATIPILRGVAPAPTPRP